MNARWWIWALLLAAGMDGSTLGSPTSQPDPRLQSLAYDPGRVVVLRGAPGYQLTLELSPDEQIENVAIGDSTSWQVSANKAGNHLFLRPAQAGGTTNMTVVTTVRVYNFDLVAQSGPTDDMAYTVRFEYPEEAGEGITGQPDASRAAAPASRYRIEGERALRPSLVTDDGLHTFVSWPAESALPATFQVTDDGQERLVNGAMRGNRFVIDGTAKKLVFRIDRHVAWANRLPPKRPR